MITFLFQKKVKVDDSKISQKQSAASSVYNMPKRDKKSHYFQHQGLKRNIQVEPEVTTLVGDKPCEPQGEVEEINEHTENINWQMVATNSQPSFVSQQNPFYAKFMEDMSKSEDESKEATTSDLQLVFSIILTFSKT